MEWYTIETAESIHYELPLVSGLEIRAYPEPFGNYRVEIWEEGTLLNGGEILSSLNACLIYGIAFEEATE